MDSCRKSKIRNFWSGLSDDKVIKLSILILQEILNHEFATAF
jgi:hypothetical protein